MDCGSKFMVAILGSWVDDCVDGHPLTIIGVAAPGFDYPNMAVLWKPAAFSSGNNGWSNDREIEAGSDVDGGPCGI